MLIRVKGYNAGVQEYLEEGIKSGREFTRDELDERVILDGDLDLTRRVYESIEDKGQDRYLSITLAFREDEIPYDALLNITQEFKQFMMYAYKDDEFNFYAEAHLPKIKTITDKATGDVIERKPHIHIVIPKKNMLSGNIFDPVGASYSQSEKHLEAFQEYINQKYNLASPREHVRADIKDAASVLSRYKGDDFYGKNREFKQDLVKQVIERGVVTRPDFYALVAEHGETRIRNEGKDNEYIAVKLPGDAKFTNLKDTIFHDDFIVRRELKKAPLDKKVIQDRLLAWPQRAKEIKYVSKATPAFRKLYTASSPDERLRLLADRERTFYQTYGDRYGSLYPPERERDNQRSAVEAKGRGHARASIGVQDVPVSDVADHGQAGQTGSRDGAVLLPGNAHLHLGQPHTGGDPGLRPPIRAGGGRGSTGESGRRQLTAFPQGSNGATKPAGARGTAQRPGRSKSVAPPFPRNPHRIPTIADIEARSRRLFGPLKRAVDSELKFQRATIKSLTVNKSASTVAAYFNRQLEQNQLAPAQRHAIRRVNKQFFDLKRTLFADSRLTREERTQLVSVLTFERLKANQQIKSTSSMSEVQLMGSAQIRHLITVEKEDPGFSFSGPTGPGPAGIRDRVKQILDRVSRQLDQPASKERARELAAKDLYTKKARFSQNVHYLDKHSDKTLFVDSGKAISMRRTGITEGGVAVALQLAKERFGSTLTITGTPEFKKLVIEAAAKNGVNVHFTDKDMNQSLLARRAELEIEKEAQTISPAEAPVEPNTEPAPAGKSQKVVDIEVSGRAVEVHLDDPIQVESVSRELNFQVAALGDRANLLGEQLVAFSARQNLVQLPTVSELSAEQLGVERDRVWGLAEIGAPIPPNIMSDPARLEWFREGLTARIPMLEAGNGQPGSVDEKSLAASVALLAQVDERRAVAATVGPPTVISLPSAQTLEALNSKIARVTKEQSTTLDLKANAELALNKLTGAVAQLNIAPTQPGHAAATDTPLVAVHAQSPSELVRREAAWRLSMQMPRSTALSEADVRASDTVMGLRGEDHAVWLVGTNDKSPEAVAMIRSYMENDSYRDAFKGAIEDFYARSQNSPESIQSLDEVTDFVVPLVNEIEGRKHAASATGVDLPAPVAKQPDDRKIIVGVLVDHGAAPYQNKPDKEQSYFVTVETDAGSRTLWGAGLADAMQDAPFNTGERLRIEDKGTVPVVLQLQQEDGTFVEKSGYRREWTVELETTERDGPAIDAAPTLSNPEEDHGPEMD